MYHQRHQVLLTLLTFTPLAKVTTIIAHGAVRALAAGTAAKQQLALQLWRLGQDFWMK